MIQPNLEEYELIQKTHIPERSVLLGLEPIGLGTGYQESLSSYFLRLASAHSLSPQALLKLLKTHRPDDFPRPGLWSKSHINALTSINGRGSVAHRMAKILEDLTNVGYLTTMTLIPMADCISDQGLLADKKRWCPQCISECLSTGNAYGLLLWQLKLVTACPVHEIPLTLACGCKETTTLPGTRGKHLPHVCHKCGAILGHNKRQGRTHVEEKELILARQIRDLLGSEVFRSDHKVIGSSGVSIFLREVARVYLDGNTALLARHLAVGKSTLHGWVHGLVLPSLWNVIGMAETFGCTIQAVLAGDIESTSFQGKLRIQLPRQYRVRTHDEWMAVREDLICPIEGVEDAVSSINGIARKHSIDRRSILDKFPNESAALVSRRVKWIRRRKEEINQQRSALIQLVADQLTSMGIYPSRRKIQSCLRGEFAIFSPELKDACKQAREKILVKR